MRPFVRDLLTALAAVAIPMLLVGWIAGVMPPSTRGASSSILALAPLYLAYLVPVALLVVGLRYRRPGLIAGMAAFGAGDA